MSYYSIIVTIIAVVLFFECLFCNLMIRSIKLSSRDLVDKLRNGISKTDDITEEELLAINNGLKIAANIIESHNLGYPDSEYLKNVDMVKIAKE